MRQTLAAEGLRAVQQREAAALALHRDQKRAERRQSRRQRDKHLSSPRPSAEAEWEAASLDDLEDIALRPGFLQHQLAVRGLSPLGRWCIELRLLEGGKRGELPQASAPTSATMPDIDAIKRESALRSFLTVLERDKLCYDTVYALGDGVQDVLSDIRDDGDEATGVDEVLCFSSFVGGVACRLTCLRRGNEYCFRSSLYIPRLEEELRCLITHREDGGGGAEDALRFIRCRLGEEQAQ